MDVASQAGDADSSRALGLNPGSWTEPGSLNVHYSSLLLHHGVDTLVFLFDIAMMFFHIFQRIALNWIVSRTDVTCAMWLSSDQSDMYHSETSIYYIHTEIGSTIALFYVLSF